MKASMDETGSGAGLGEGRGSRPIVICADDYGLNDGVNSAILDLARMGRISATSCMANAPGWRQAARALSPLAGRIGIGLHLTLTWGTPLGPMPALAPGGTFPDLGSVLRKALLGRLVSQEIDAEIGWQLDSFSAGMGRPPDFVDGHQHVHVLPGIRQALLGVLAKRGLAGRLWLRDPADRVGAILRRQLSAPKALFVAALAAGFRTDAARAGFTTNRGFSGFGPFDPDRSPGADMAAYVRALGRAPLLMCHPGRATSELGQDEIAAARLVEYGYLASQDFADVLARASLVLKPSPIS